jgi:hypothetical protein
MFYWQNSNHRALVTDKEEEDILKILKVPPLLAVRYKVSGEESVKKEINEYLNQWSIRDPDGFHKKFVHRTIESRLAQKLLPSYLKIYCETTGLATTGKRVRDGYDYLDQRDPFEKLLDPENTYEDEFIFITLINRGRFRWSDPTFDKYIRIRSKSIKKIDGIVSDFILETEQMIIDFGKKSVRISVL